MASGAHPLDIDGVPKRSAPRIALLPDGRLRYTDIALYNMNENVYSVMSGLDVGFNAEGWQKFPTGNQGHLHYRIPRSWGTLDVSISLRQVAKGVVEGRTVMETVDPVT